MTLSFDRAQQRHDANTEPLEPRSCADGEHEPDPDTFRVSEEDKPNLVALVDCEKCGATADTQPQLEDWVGWEL